MIPIAARIEAAWLTVIPIAAAAAYVGTGGAHAGWLFLVGWIPLAVSTAIQPRAALQGQIAARGRISALVSALIVGFRNADTSQFVTRFLIEQAVLDIGCLVLALAGMLVAKNLTDGSLGMLPTLVAGLFALAGAALLLPVFEIGSGLDPSFGLAFLTALGAKAALVDGFRNGAAVTRAPPAASTPPRANDDADAWYILVLLGLWLVGLPIVAAVFHPDGLCGIGDCSD